MSNSYKIRLKCKAKLFRLLSTSCLGIVLLLAGCGQNNSNHIPALVPAPEENSIPPSAESNEPSVLNDTFIVGVLYWSMNIPGQVSMRKGLEDEAGRINRNKETKGLPGVELVPYVAGDGVVGMERQIEQMNNLIKQQVDMIIVQPTDIAALSKPLKRANEVGIPVIAYDQHILGGDLTSFLTSNNYEAGYLDGEYVAANFSNNKILHIILVEYPHVSSTVSRVNGFIDALEDYGQSFNIPKTYIAVEPVGGAKVGSEILQDFPEKGSIDVIFTVNDGGGLAVVDALEKAGRKEIFVACVDGDPMSVDNIRGGGIIRIDCAQFCGELGAESMRAAYKFLLGEEIGREILIPVFPITRETLEMYKGWSAPIPAPFEKPWLSKSPQWTGEIKVVN